MNYVRAKALDEFGASYRLVLCAPGCVYCGAKASGVDHVPPLRFVHAAGSARFVYPACHWCNSALGPLPDLCLRDRAAFIVRSGRQEWAAEARGRSRVRVQDAIRSRGQSVKDRLASGAVARVCQCVRCSRESTGLAKTQDLGEG